MNDPTIWIDLAPNVQQTFDVTRREAVVRLVPANELDLKQEAHMSEPELNWSNKFPCHIGPQAEVNRTGLRVTSFDTNSY